jgi:tetratricopeptide (TPR) repeat protein
MRINRNLVLGFVVFTGLGTAIFFLPKAVVNNKKMANRDSTASAPQMAETVSDHSLDSTMLSGIEELRKEISVTKVEKEKAKVYTRLADAFLRANRFDSAGSCFEKASELTADPKLVYKAGSAYFEGITFASNPSKVEFLSGKAREMFEKIEEKDPNSVESQGKIAMTWVNSETPMKGILKLRELADKNPTNEYLAYQLGMLSFQSGQYEKAVARFESVIKLNKENVNAFFYLAQSLKELGKKKEALVAVNNGLSLVKEEDTKASFLELKKQLTEN